MAEAGKSPAKLYVAGDALFADSFRLARLVVASEWEPDLLLALWRGGAPIAITIDEYYRHLGRPKEHHVVFGRSYSGTTPNAELKLSIPDHVKQRLRRGGRVLIIDDIFDSGRTAVALKEQVELLGGEVRIATLYWKPDNSRERGSPDYHIHQTGAWVVFPHELDGLSRSEIAAKSAAIAAMTRDTAGDAGSSG